MSEDNMTRIIVAAITVLVPAAITLIVERWKLSAPAEPKAPDGAFPPTVTIEQSAASVPVSRKSALGRVLIITLVIALLILILWPPPGSLSLWTFDQNSQNWQPEKFSDLKPASAATGVDWTEESLQGDFDFSNVKPENLSGDMEPRATFFIDPVQVRDWSEFQTLTFEVDNRSTHDLEAFFTISNITNGSNCWYEFGESQPVPRGQKSSLRFDLTKQSYKTCFFSEDDNQPPATFSQVWRFDIIFGTPEDPWDEVRGFVLIDNIKLTDRVR